MKGSDSFKNYAVYRGLSDSTILQCAISKRHFHRLTLIHDTVLTTFTCLQQVPDSCDHVCLFTGGGGVPSHVRRSRHSLGSVR